MRPANRLTRQSGLTLVELMIAVALGLLLLATLGYLYVNNRQAFRTLDNVARLQENGRYAMEVLGQDLRMVGYIGCGSLTTISPVMTANPDPLLTLNMQTALQGTEGPDTDADTVTLYRLDGRGMTLTKNMADTKDSLTVSASPQQYAAGTPFLIADCTKADIFRASETVERGATSIAHAMSHNDSDALSAAYDTDAMVFPFQEISYSIAANPAGNPALYRAVNGNSQEVVENVKDMQIVYGVDTSGDGAVDAYVTADKVTDWARVLAVRVSLLLRSPEAGVATQPQTGLFWDTDNDGKSDLNTSTDPDVQARRLLYVFTSTIGLRNRLR